MYLITMNPPIAAEAKARKIVLISPEFINAIIKNVMKNMSAAPKSRIKISAPTQATENIIKRIIFLEV